MTEEEFKKLAIGALVRLNSGGPSMTVTFVDTGSLRRNVDVCWIDSDGLLQKHAFQAICLTQVFITNF